METNWSQKGATLSDKSARQEFGLTQQEIVAAIRAGKLQYREGRMHGNPWLRLLRHEVEALVSETCATRSSPKWSGRSGRRIERRYCGAQAWQRRPSGKSGKGPEWVWGVGTMSASGRKHVEPDDKIGLNLTAAERNTILEDVRFLDDDYEQALCETPIGHAIEFTLGDWDYLGGEIYFEAEEADNPERRRRLNGIYARIEELLKLYCTHGEPE